MCNTLQVDNAVVAVLERLEYQVGQDCRCMKYSERVWGILHMCHVVVWDQNACDNAYLNHVHQVVCCMALKTLIRKTGLCYNKFSCPNARHLYYVSHDTPCFSTPIYLNF